MTNQPEEQPVALIDLDGSTADFDKSMKVELKAIAGPGENPIHWTTEYEDLPYMKARRRLIKSRPGFWRDLDEVALGFEVIRILKGMEFRLHVLTKGPSESSGVSAYSEKIEWVRKHLPGVPATISDEKGLVYGRVLLDDWPPYVESWLKWRPRGLVVSVAQPWNVGLDQKFNQVVRYDGTNRDELIKRLTDQKARK